MLKKERGITLVALVITIIILLILAGVSLSLVFSSDNGLLTKASEGRVNYTNAQIEEQKVFEDLEAYMESLQ